MTHPETEINLFLLKVTISQNINILKYITDTRALLPKYTFLALKKLPRFEPKTFCPAGKSHSANLSNVVLGGHNSRVV